jgi:hypothetical protein
MARMCMKCIRGENVVSSELTSLVLAAYFSGKTSLSARTSTYCRTRLLTSIVSVRSSVNVNPLHR